MTAVTFDCTCSPDAWIDLLDRPIVEKLCMKGAKPVQKLHAQIFLCRNAVMIGTAAAVDVVFAPRFA
jgi:hypothetical protein